MILYIALGILILFVFVNVLIDLINNSSYNRKYNEVSELANNEYLEVQNAKNIILKDIEAFYGKDIKAKLEKGIIVTGMHKTLVRFAYGNPKEVKEEFKYNKKVERWYYNGSTNRLGNVKYKLELFIENNYLQGWKDL